MCDPVFILRLYSSVLHEHKREYDVSEADIRTAIQNMKEVYKPNPGSLANSIVYVADYNDAAHRCAYLHKYAPFHTALVADMLGRALQQNRKLFQDLIYASGRINICSLGGGPGTDIFGALSALNTTFGFFPASAIIIDIMGKWRNLFYELILELRYGNYGALGECVGEQYFDWKYLQHNLLDKMTDQVKTAIGKANLVTMIKFVSASSCKDTSVMIKKIFASMKHGALVVYIDNAGGGFHKLVTKEAEDCKFESVFYLNHKTFKEPAVGVKKFGCTPCCESRISIHIWRKAFPKKRNSIPNYSFRERIFFSSTSNAILSSKKYENQLRNESLVIDKWVSVSSTSTGSFSRITNEDHTDLFQETAYSKYSANTCFTSNEMNSRMPGNSSELHKKAYPRKPPEEESMEYIAKEIIDVDFVSKQLQLKHNAVSIDASDMKKPSKSSEPQRKSYPREILADESIQYGIHKNNFNTNYSDFARPQLYSHYRTCPSDTSNLNAITIESTRGESSEILNTTERTQVAAQESLPNSNSSTRLSWWDRIRGRLCQELIGLISEEFIEMFQDEERNIIGATVGERFQFYLFENM